MATTGNSVDFGDAQVLIRNRNSGGMDHHPTRFVAGGGHMASPGNGGFTEYQLILLKSQLQETAVDFGRFESSKCSGHRLGTKECSNGHGGL